jgi:type III pantothenate kinase
VAIRRPGQVVGTDTVRRHAVRRLLGYVALIDGLIARIKAEYGRPMTVVWRQGGSRPYLRERLRRSTVSIPT